MVSTIARIIAAVLDLILIILKRQPPRDAESPIDRPLANGDSNGVTVRFAELLERVRNRARSTAGEDRASGE